MNRILTILKIATVIYFLNIVFLIIGFFILKNYNLNFSNFFINYFEISKNSNNKEFNSKNNIFWANEIIKGGYILYFRHSERSKFQNSKAFDGYEIINDIKAENSFFSNRTCLNDNGKVEAKIIGKYFKKYNIKFSQVISSPSCRARQTAILAFEKIDEISNTFMYLTPFVESINENKKNNQKIKINKIKDYFYSLKIHNNQNIIIVGHKGIILPELIKNNYSKSDLQTQESGFVILEIVNKDIFFKYKFNSFENFTISLNSINLD